MSETEKQDYWRKCSSCKKPIGLGARYYVCSVSTCNSQRTGYVFCSVHCFERHLPGARHKDAGAVEKTAPMTPAVMPSVGGASGSTASATGAGASGSAAASGTSSSGTSSGGVSSAGSPAAQPAAAARPPNRVFATTPTSKPASSQSQIPREVLVIASRLKDYITARSEFNTSQSVMDVLSDHLRIVCDRAIDNARADGRKTVMDRDFEFLKR